MVGEDLLIFSYFKKYQHSKLFFYKYFNYVVSRSDTNQSG